MTRWFALVIVVAASLIGGFRAHAQSSTPAGPSGDAVAGRQVALNVCSACHVVAPDQEPPPLLRDAAPSFADIANRPSVTAASLQRFITTAHATLQNPRGMPNPQLTDGQTADVVAYLMSLRRPLRP